MKRRWVSLTLYTCESALTEKKAQRFAKFANNEWSLLTCPELDALGDELLFDDDSTYLDEASTAPSIPEGVPGDKSTNRVFHTFRGFFVVVVVRESSLTVRGFVFQDGVLVDEFGLPQIPAS